MIEDTDKLERLRPFLRFVATGRDHFIRSMPVGPQPQIVLFEVVLDSTQPRTFDGDTMVYRQSVCPSVCLPVCPFVTVLDCDHIH